ncbi:MAG: sigma-70 family RNA polymerase sigma factor [Flavobacteriaceae bacterium]|nr:sigma-70 family RNA polymerase sigma factor [Flavobacteriaceae bacterium]
MQNQNQNIKALLNKCLKGEPSAQFEIYKCYYKAMYNTALRILNDKFEAEDIMQESFLTAFSKLDTFKSESKFGNENIPFGAWLKRIIVTKSLTQLKKNKKIAHYNNNYKTIKNLQIINDHVETDYNTLKVEEILEAIKKLKTNYSLVLSLSLVEGYDNDEIAQILNTNNQQVRTTISRAKNSLRKILGNISV